MSSIKIFKLANSFEKKINNYAKIANSSTKEHVYYTGIVLSSDETEKLRQLLPAICDDFIIEYGIEFEPIRDWKDSSIGAGHNRQQLNHHMTIVPSSCPEPVKDRLGEEVSLTIDGFGASVEKNIAAWRVVDPGVPVKAKTPHVTALLGPGGKPFLAGEISQWMDISPIQVIGTILEIK